MPAEMLQSESLTKGVIIAPVYEPAHYPDDVVNYRQYIIHEELPENTRPGSQLLVFVRKVTSPSEFWINLSGSMYSAKLHALCHEMRNFYESHHEHYVMPLYAVTYGQFCVCLFRNEWHRSRILNVTDSTCQVQLIDFGGTVLMNHENLRFMHKQFSDLPMQSFRAEISDVRPRQSGDWPSNVCEWFRIQTGGRRFTAEVSNFCSQSYSLKIKLFDSGGHSISHLLLSSDMADAETPAVKSVHEQKELLRKPTANDNILTSICPEVLTTVSLSKSRVCWDEHEISSEHTNRSTPTYCPATMTNVSTSKAALEWDERDVLPRSETSKGPISNALYNLKELQHKQSTNECVSTTVSPRTLMKVPNSKLELERDQRDSASHPKTFQRQTVGSAQQTSEVTNKQTANKNGTTMVSQRPLMKVSALKLGPKFDESDSTPRFEKRNSNVRTTLTIEDVTISGNDLLLVTLGDSFHFVLSEFLHAFVGVHEHVVLKVLEGLGSDVRLVKLPDSCMRLFFVQLKGRTVAGLNTDSKRLMATIYLLPLCEVEELITFLKLDGSEIEDLRYFLSSLL